MLVNDFCCENMRRNTGDEYRLVYYSEKFGEYGIVMPEDGNSYMLIHFCPWCGKRLPASKREEWFHALEKLGFEAPLGRDDIPEAYKSGAWRNRGTREND